MRSRHHSLSRGCGSASGRYRRALALSAELLSWQRLSHRYCLAIDAGTLRPPLEAAMAQLASLTLALVPVLEPVHGGITKCVAEPSIIGGDELDAIEKVTSE